MNPLDKQILDLEKQVWRDRGAKEQAIADRLGITVTRYYQLLKRVLDSQEAMLFDPVTVHRLRRLRDRPRHAATRYLTP